MCYAGGPRCSSEALRRLERTRARYTKLLASGEGFSKQALSAKDAYETAVKEWELTPAGVRTVEQNDPLRAEILRQTALSLLQRRRAEVAPLYLHSEDTEDDDDGQQAAANTRGSLHSLSADTDLNNDPRAQNASSRALDILTNAITTPEYKTSALATLMGVSFYANSFLGETEDGEYLSAQHLHGLASCFLTHMYDIEQAPAAGQCADFTSASLHSHLLDGHEQRLHPQTLGMLASHEHTDPSIRARVIRNYRTPTPDRVEGTRHLDHPAAEQLMYSFAQEPHPAPPLALAIAQQLDWNASDRDTEARDLIYGMARKHLLDLGIDPAIKDLPDEWLAQLL